MGRSQLPRPPPRTPPGRPPLTCALSPQWPASRSEVPVPELPRANMYPGRLLSIETEGDLQTGNRGQTATSFLRLARFQVMSKVANWRLRK